MKVADLPQWRQLSVGEKLALVEDLWNDIAAQTEAAPIPDWHRRALDEDAAEYARNPRAGAPWSEARARLLQSR